MLSIDSEVVHHIRGTDNVNFKILAVVDCLHAHCSRVASLGATLISSLASSVAISMNGKLIKQGWPRLAQMEMFEGIESVPMINASLMYAIWPCNDVRRCVTGLLTFLILDWARMLAWRVDLRKGRAMV